MSVKVQAKIWDIRVGSLACKAVAVKLADHANDDGTEIWPARQTVADELECSTRCVERSINRLLALGVLKVTQFNGHKRKPTNYAFDMDVIQLLLDGTIALNTLEELAISLGYMDKTGKATKAVHTMMKLGQRVPNIMERQAQMSKRTGDTGSLVTGDSQSATGDSLSKTSDSESTEPSLNHPEPNAREALSPDMDESDPARRKEIARQLTDLSNELAAQQRERERMERGERPVMIGRTHPLYPALGVHWRRACKARQVQEHAEGRTFRVPEKLLTTLQLISEEPESEHAG